MARDSFPILMPLLVCTWSAIGLGQDDLSLRCPGTLIGLGILAAIWLTAWSAWRPLLFSLVLLGLNLVAIIYGDFLQAYGLGSLLIVFTTATMWMFVKTPGNSPAVIRLNDRHLTFLFSVATFLSLDAQSCS